MTDTVDRSAILAAMAAFPDRVAAAARAVAHRAVPAAEWSPEQVVRHLIAVEREVHQARIRDLATVTDPQWEWAEPGPWEGAPELDLHGVITLFAEARAATLATLRALDDAGWARSGTHTTFGTLDADGLARNAVDHDEEHLGGLARD